MHRFGKDLTIVTYGTFVNQAMQTAEILATHGVDAAVVRLLKINPLNAEGLLNKMPVSDKVIIVEEIAGNCGIHESLSCLLKEKNPNLLVKGYDLGTRYIPHGSVEELYDLCGLSPEKLAKTIMVVLQNEN